MTGEPTAQTVLFPDLAAKPLVVKMDEEHSSSDGGAVLLKGIDGALGLTESLVDCLRDPRQPGKVAHTFAELLQQRVFAIALPSLPTAMRHQSYPELL